MAAESWFFVLAQTALGFGDGRLPGVRWVMHGQRGSRQLVCQQHHGLQSYRPGRPWRWAPQTVVCACPPPPPALARSASARDSTRPAREAQATPCPGRWGGGPPRPEESQGGGREPAEVSGVHSCGARCRPGEEACRLNAAPSSFSLCGHGPASPPTRDLGHLAAPESAVGRRLRPGLRTRGRCSGEGGQENREASWRMWHLTPQSGPSLWAGLSLLPGAMASVCARQKAHWAYVRSSPLPLTPSVTLGPASRPLPWQLLYQMSPHPPPAPPLQPQVQLRPPRTLEAPRMEGHGQERWEALSWATSRLHRVGASGRVLQTGEMPSLAGARGPGAGALLGACSPSGLNPGRKAGLLPSPYLEENTEAEGGAGPVPRIFRVLPVSPGPHLGARPTLHEVFRNQHR